MFYFGSFNYFMYSAEWLSYDFHLLYEADIYFSIILELFHRKMYIGAKMLLNYLLVSYKIFMYNILFILIMQEWFSCLLQMLF